MTEILEDEAERQYTSFARNEPAILKDALLGPITGAVVLFAPGHADQLAEQITAAAVAAGVALTGFIVRRYVAPEWKARTGRTLPDVPLGGVTFDDDDADDLALEPVSRPAHKAAERHAAELNAK